MRALHLIGTAVYLATLLCWAGVLPAWRLAPGPVQPALEMALSQLLLPALVLGGAILLVTLLRLAGALRGVLDRLASLSLQVAGILFACLALRAVGGLSFAGYSLGWNLVDIALHVGAGAAVFILPCVALIAAVAGLANLLRRELRAA